MKKLTSQSFFLMSICYNTSRAANYWLLIKDVSAWTSDDLAHGQTTFKLSSCPECCHYFDKQVSCKFHVATANANLGVTKGHLLFLLPRKLLQKWLYLTVVD